jgi:UDP-N-acetylglucosamine 3-dehydrogenase
MIRVGLFGLGVMGRNHLRILGGMPDVQVVAVCDPKVKPDAGLAWYDSPVPLLETEKPDVALIAVPTPLHCEIALACAEHGIHLFVEKPVSATVAQSKRMIDAVGRAGLRSAVGHVERFNPVVQALRHELAGKHVFSIGFTRVGHMPPRIGDVGVLTDLAVHDLDLLRFITGKDALRTTIYKSRKIHNHHEDTANVALELEGGILATLTTNWLTPFKRRKIEVTTEQGYFEADLISQELVEYSAYRDDDTFLTRPCRVRKGEPLANELAALMTYLNTGERGDLATFQDSLFTLEIIENAVCRP